MCVILYPPSILCVALKNIGIGMKLCVQYAQANLLNPDSCPAVPSPELQPQQHHLQFADFQEPSFSPKRIIKFKLMVMILNN